MNTANLALLIAGAHAWMPREPEPGSPHVEIDCSSCELPFMIHCTNDVESAKCPMCLAFEAEESIT